MKKIGFIDYFLDEWHAENYPQWIEENRLMSIKRLRPTEKPPLLFLN
jgi:hypothetical protein